MKNRYQVQKVRDLLAAGGFRPKHAHRLGKHLNADDSTAVESQVSALFDCTRPQFAMHGSDHGVATMLLEFVAKVKTASQAAIDEKILAVNTNMQRPEYKETSGCNSVVECTIEASSVPDGWELLYLNESGASAWISTFRAYSMRFGPANFPLPGIACIIGCLDKPVKILLYPIAEMLSQGIAITDFLSFLEMEAGTTYEDQSSMWVTLAEGDCVFVPHGYICLPIYAAECLKPGPWATVWVLPLFEPIWGARLSQNVLNVVAGYNRPQFAEQMQKRMWSSRSALFEKFMLKLGVPLVDQQA